MSMKKCPKCKTGTLEYDFDYIGCEVETYHCTSKNCDTEFHVDIEIVRDFDNMREVAR